jgi:CheY-like chemotaxis protein
MLKGIIEDQKGSRPHVSLHVLLAEDDPDIRLVSRLALKKAGYRVTAATNGLELLQKLAEERPDVILLDYMMPDMDGAEACRRIKADPATRDIPVIFVTAKSQPQAGLDDLGAAGVIQKPYDALTLGDQLARILESLR